MYIQIQYIRVIWCSLFLLIGYTHGLQLGTGDMYEVGVYVVIYGHTQS
jgi:hypothetical protein